MTPLTLTLPRSDEAAAFELRAEGRQSVQQRVSLGRDATVHLVLAEAPAASPPSTARRRRDRRNAVIDPFE
ncbi:MAG: hypothetical protein M5U28_01275 [Sandaracinaceae bacterium]|nr:hypothetical protein [Sandaracinaceae bacterium]